MYQSISSAGRVYYADPRTRKQPRPAVVKAENAPRTERRARKHRSKDVNQQGTRTSNDEKHGVEVEERPVASNGPPTAIDWQNEWSEWSEQVSSAERAAYDVSTSGMQSIVTNTSASDSVLQTQHLPVSISKLVGGLYFMSMHGGALKHSERIPPGPVVFVTNHWSDGDAFFLCSMLPRKMDELCIIANGEIARKSQAMQMMMQQVEVVLAEEHSKGNSIAQASQAIARGKSVIVFPQGALCSPRARVSKTPAHTGFAVISSVTSAPIVPIMLYGTHLAWPPGQNLPMPGPKIVGIVGHAIPAHMVPGVDLSNQAPKPSRNLKQFAKTVMKNLYDMRHQARRAYKR